MWQEPFHFQRRHVPFLMIFLWPHAFHMLVALQQLSRCISCVEYLLILSVAPDSTGVATRMSANTLRWPLLPLHLLLLPQQLAKKNTYFNIVILMYKVSFIPYLIKKCCEVHFKKMHAVKLGKSKIPQEWWCITPQ